MGSRGGYGRAVQLGMRWPTGCCGDWEVDMLEILFQVRRTSATASTLAESWHAKKHQTMLISWCHEHLRRPARQPPGRARRAPHPATPTAATPEAIDSGRPPAARQPAARIAHAGRATGHLAQHRTA